MQCSLQAYAICLTQWLSSIQWNIIYLHLLLTSLLPVVEAVQSYDVTLTAQCDPICILNIVCTCTFRQYNYHGMLIWFSAWSYVLQTMLPSLTVYTLLCWSVTIRCTPLRMATWFAATHCMQNISSPKHNGFTIQFMRCHANDVSWFTMHAMTDLCVSHVYLSATPK